LRYFGRKLVLSDGGRHCSDVYVCYRFSGEGAL
jgi:hypothetical protein